MPPQCCRCNGSGRCRACKCVREGKTCTGCTPGRNGRCENIDGSTPPEPEPHTQEAEPPAIPEHDARERCVVETMDAVGHDGPLPSNHTTVAGIPINSISQPCNSTSQGPLPVVPTPAPESPSSLPSPEQISTANFQWGEYDGSSLGHAIKSAYVEAVHWRRNIFMIPSGKAGKDYVKEQARLFSAYSD